MPHPIQRVRRQPWTSFYSVDMDGVNDCVRRTSGFASLPTAMTVLCWVYSRNTASVAYLFEIGSSSTNRLALLHRGTTNQDMWVYATISGVGTASVTGGTWDGTSPAWLLAALTWDTVGGAITGYFDGASIGADSLIGTMPSTKASIGTRTDYSTGPMSMRWSQFAILDTVLTASQIAELAANPHFDLAAHPNMWMALNPSHVGDSTATGGTLYDWHPRGQDWSPLNMDSSDIVTAAP